MVCGFDSRRSGESNSATFPPSITRIRSDFIMVFNRWLSFEFHKRASKRVDVHSRYR